MWGMIWKNSVLTCSGTMSVLISRTDISELAFEVDRGDMSGESSRSVKAGGFWYDTEKFKANSDK